jgi:asparagine synthase (glutamine-hydrolysing)
MCGICGVVYSNPRFVDEDVLKQMCRILYHRGPDDEGYYRDKRVGLGVRRLSIIDLSTGRQPLSNEEGTLWIVFNGEIYNYRQLRTQLEQRGHLFSTQTDTEVIVHAYEEYGEGCLEHFNGMFSFAIWDTINQRLFLARDRLGIKPMFYWSSGHQLIFGSELKAVLQHPDVPREINLPALDQFLTLEYIPAPTTIFKGINKLLPGHFLVFQAGQLNLKQYWEIPFREAPTNEAVCVEILTELINEAIQSHLVSDVPVGAFLSGGIDSSTIVAFMNEATTEPVLTFSVGFEDKTYNELSYARAVATAFETHHHEEVLIPDLITLVERLVCQFDEPFADFSIFPTFLVSEMAKRHVTVVLSGDGGDELFAGYEAYIAQRLDRLYRLVPLRLRQEILPALIGRMSPQPGKKGLINKAKRFIEGGALPSSLQHTRWMTFINNKDKQALYQPEFCSALNGFTAASIIENYFQRVSHMDSLAQQQYVDIKTYLADDILTKVDRMSMAASIEARVPLLDHRIVEFAMSLPPHLKLNRGQTKIILRKAMADRLPPEVLNKPKQGFSIPLKDWLRGPLRPLMMELLSVDTIRRRGYFESDCVSRWISEHLAGHANHSHRLWALMVLELWHQNVFDQSKFTGSRG